ncbi:uncharacterized protein B0H64DRAFT_64527 [Chaetomium fimeti]|jgi:hypothetical protein|uniref:AA1-like domain-containing protein n=1 Tax=Chaetomium fimeti TaxID=1854472 RepID=A0AAE0H561_9PEZI|nr:hypothetical protein B0H64DRAFT_64527 [Chaetomium fimeti]
MRFAFAATAALFGSVLAAPAPQVEEPEIKETVSIQDFYARKSHLVDGTLDGPVDSVTFNIVASRAEGTIAVVCTAKAAEGEDSIKFKPESYNCDGVKETVDQYRFEVAEISEQNVYTIMVIHQTAPAFGFWGNTEVPTHCRAGGNESMICGQVGEVTAELHL